MAEVSEGQRIEKGTRLRVYEHRRCLLGPFAGTLLVDFPEQIADLQRDAVERLAAEGIDAIALPEFDRGEWLGVFDFEVEVVLEVVGFHAAKGKSAEEVQQASIAHVLYLLGFIVLAVFGYLTVDRIVEPVLVALDLVPSVFPLVAVALGFLAIALLVREVRKAKALTHGT